MKMKYCPNCASMTFKTAANGAEQCRKCGYAGEMKWDSVDIINALGRRVKGGSAPIFQKKKSNEVEDIEGLEKQGSGEGNEGSEDSKGFRQRLPERKVGQGKEGGLGASELKEKMKGKASSDWEVI